MLKVSKGAEISNRYNQVLNSYKWFKDSPYLFQKAFKTIEVQQMVRKFMESLFVVGSDVLSTYQASRL